MANKTEITDLDIDITGLIESQVELAKEILKTKKALKELTKETKTNTKSSDQASKAITKLSTNLKKLNKEYSSNKKVLVSAVKSQQNYDKALKKGNKTISDAKKNTKELQKIRKTLTKNTAESAKRLDELNAKIKSNDKLIKSSTSSGKEHSSWVSGYSTLVTKAAEALGLEGKSLELVSFLTDKLSSMQRKQALATGVGTKAMKIFRLALASTGIGLLVIALGSLMTYFATTEKGASTLRNIMAGFGVVVAQIQSVFAGIGETMMDAFSNPKQAVADLWEFIKTNIMNRLEGLKDSFVALGKLASAALRFDWDEVGKQALNYGKAILQANTGIDSEQWAVLGKEINKTAKNALRAAEIQRELEALDKRKKVWLTEEKKLQQEVGVELKKATDASLSEKERTDAMTKAKVYQQEIVRMNNSLAEEELRLMTEKYNMNNKSDAQVEELRVLTEKVNDTKRAGVEQTKKVEDAEKAMYKSIREEQVKSLESTLEMYHQRALAAKKSFDDELMYQKEAYDKEDQILKEKLAGKLITQQEYNLQKLTLDTEYEAKKKEIANASAQHDITMFELNSLTKRGTYEEELTYQKELNDMKMNLIKQQLDAGLISVEDYNRDKLTQENEYLATVNELGVANSEHELEMFEMKKGRNLTTNEAKLSYEIELNQRKQELLEEQLDKKLITQEEFNNQELALELETAEVRKELEEEKEEEQAEKEEEEFEIKLMEEQNEYDRQRMELDNNYEKDLAAAEKNGDSAVLIHAKYAKAKSDIDAKEREDKLKLASSISGSIADLLGKDTIAGKAAAIAEATINTYLSASSALKAGPIVGPIMAGIAIAQGLKTVADITNVKLPSFEDGGSFEIGGNRHSQGGTRFLGSDGTRFEAEKGEQLIILNRGASQEYRSNLSALNVRHGGVSLYGSHDLNNISKMEVWLWQMLP